MGLLLFPIIILAAIFWLICVALFIVRLCQGNISSIWSLPVGYLISIGTYFLGVSSWIGKTEVWALEPLLILPFSCIIFPALFAFIGVFAPKEIKILNVIGFSICFSVIISGLALFLFGSLTQADTFVKITLTH